MLIRTIMRWHLTLNSMWNIRKRKQQVFVSSEECSWPAEGGHQQGCWVAFGKIVSVCIPQPSDCLRELPPLTPKWYVKKNLHIFLSEVGFITRGIVKKIGSINICCRTTCASKEPDRYRNINLGRFLRITLIGEELEAESDV